MDEILKTISENPDTITDMASGQVDEARQALADFVGKVRNGEIEATAAQLDEAKTLSEKLAERSDTIAAEQAQVDATLSELETSLGLVEVEEVEEEPVEEVTEDLVVEELVTASAQPSLGQIAKAQPKQAKPEEPPSALTASAIGYEGVNVVDRTAFGSMAVHRAKSKTGRGQETFGSFSSEDLHRFSVKPGDDEGNARTLNEVGKLAAEEGNLVASGGFCAPADQLYDFFNIATRAGILVLPSVNAPRGSINLPVSPSLADFIGASGIATEWTNTNDENPTSPSTKPVYTFDCPDFQECEVSAWPTILQFGNFASRFYPEAIANASFLAGVAGDRTVNAARLAYLVAAASPGDVDAQAGLAGALVSLSHTLGGNAAFYRQKYGMSPDAPLDAIFPTWIGDAIRADIVTRDSTTDYGMAEARWRGLLDDLNLRAQFVYDLDNQTSGLLPATADILLMAPGTVVELDGGTLDLGIVRDSTLNSTNDYQTFVEPFVGWCQPGHEVLLLENVPVCATGATGERIDVACASTTTG